MKIFGYIFFIVLFFSLSNSDAAAQTCTPPPSGLVGWYPGDGNANDISSTGNHGALINGATFATGIVGQAFSLDGVDDFVQMPSNPAQDPTTAATLDAWVLFNQTPSQAGRNMEIITKGDFGNDLDLGALTDDKFVFFVKGAISVKSDTVIQSNVWYHVAGTWDSTGLKMYVNGVLDGTNATPNITRTTNTLPLTIGNGAAFDRNTFYFSGLIDEAEIFNRALSASEVAAIFNAGAAGKCKAPLTAASVTVSGRVTNYRGRGIARARITLTDANGEARTTTTNPFGYFRFDGVAAGESYIFEAQAKRYRFAYSPRVLFIGDNFADLNFIALP